MNDDIPLFTEREQETVLEGEPIGTPVTRVNAIDKDGTHPNNQVSIESCCVARTIRFVCPENGTLKGQRFCQVYYYIVDSPRNEGKDYFEINEHTGEIYTKHVFDREKQAAYALEVEARDGAPSARPNSNGQPNTGAFFFPGSLGRHFIGRIKDACGPDKRPFDVRTRKRGATSLDMKGYRNGFDVRFSSGYSPRRAL